MHLFLTGNVQVGKSTLINKVLTELQIKPGGFRTFDGTAFAGEREKVYIYPADENKPKLDDSHMIGFRKANGTCDVFTETFETIGLNILKKADQYPLILMDEIGFMESSAKTFQDSILTILDKNTPVLGTLRLANLQFIEIIKGHPKVEVVNVNKTNRNDIYEDILMKIKLHLKG